jgi:outer membrane receptor protein involved in Fe transport
VQTPLAYRPDSLWSFEVGAKSSLLGARLQIDSSVFYTMWQDIQTPIPLSNCGLGFIVNAGGATSAGFDLSVQAVLSGHFRVGLNTAYTSAHYDRTVTLNDRVVVTRGDAIGALPLVTGPWSASVTAAYETGLSSSHLTLSAQDSYHSRNPGPFASDNPMAVTYAPIRRTNPATNLLNLRGTAAWPDFEVSLYVTNVLDSQPTLQVRNHVSTDTLLYATTFRPRTVGVASKWRW